MIVRVSCVYLARNSMAGSVPVSRTPWNRLRPSSAVAFNANAMTTLTLNYAA